MRQQETEFDALHLTVKWIQENVGIISDVLDLRKEQLITTGLGQGGMPTAHLFTSFPNPIEANSNTVSPAQAKPPSILD